MATNTGEGHRIGTVKDRTQIKDAGGHWNKRDRTSGEFMDRKADDEPFKGVAKEPDGRQDD
ncbi:hypothetical protein [Notoacmeibacter sp. MSK16QG-6]|uniref:hypothetical protein n=1 Tax=Notoacmeibacter sp. MSK16QG-6 TaxID=2957982 RepID=UPI00209F2206|nr:hypothetical protein [Notoacmeibacter sp. MSK16QG-6]MCP1200151.1 hypothetical protein [Notoacmeibacter sp. MSK16QG-6]